MLFLRVVNEPVANRNSYSRPEGGFTLVFSVVVEYHSPALDACCGPISCFSFLLVCQLSFILVYNLGNDLILLYNDS